VIADCTIEVEKTEPAAAPAAPPETPAHEERPAV
jgi:hypothetical protein